MIKLNIDNCWGYIEGDLPSHVIVGISNACSFEVKGAEKSQLFKKGRWDGKKKLFDKVKKKYPVGLHNRIMAILQSHNIQYEVIYSGRAIRNTEKPIYENRTTEQRDYQLEAVEKAKEMGRGILQVATGGGKTVIAGKLIAEICTKTIFLVHTKDLLYQAKKSFENILSVDIGQLGDGIVDIQDVTVATVQTLARYLDVEYVEGEDKSDEAETDVSSRGKEIRKFMSEVGLLIFDEVHRVASDSAYNVCSAIEHAPMRIGLSASPYRDDGADIMIEAAIGEVIYKVSASFLIDEGYLVEPIIRMVNIPATIDPKDDKRTYEQIYRDEIVNNEYRNRQVLKYAADFMELDIPSLILVTQINHGKKLKKMICDEYHPIDFLSGRDFTDTRLRAIKEMRDGERISMIASTIADEGLDIKRLAGLIIAGGGKSSTKAMQRIGRVLRPFEGKTHALVIDFNDEARYLRDHSQKRKEMYSSEPRFIILEL